MARRKDNGKGGWETFSLEDDPGFQYDDEEPEQPELPAAERRIDNLRAPTASQKEVEALVSHPLKTDVWVYRIPTVALSIVVIGCVAAFAWLSFLGKPPNEALVALGAAAVGALASLLKPGRG